MNRCLWANEIDRFAAEVYERHWPDNTLTRGDIREFQPTQTVDLIAGGDPCPCRSIARGNRPSKHPDLAGYFLAMVGRLRPQWVVRENVPAPDVVHFAAALEALGYRCVIVALDARDFTGQSRRRQYCIGCPPELATRFQGILLDAADGYGFAASKPEEETPYVSCLTAHAYRLAAEDTYCFEPERGLRFLISEECEVFQGFPRGWTSGLSRSTRHRLLGNAVCVPVVRWIGERIMESIGGEFSFGELFAGIGGFRLGFEIAGSIAEAKKGGAE